MGFADDINKFVIKVASNSDAVVRKVVLDVGTSLVNKTPVGDKDFWQHPEKAPEGYTGGHARANWQHSTEAPKTNEIDAIDGKTWEGGNVSKDRIQESLAATRNAPGAVHFISNSVPYIEALEDGHSHQAPNGFVGLTVVEFGGMVEKAVAEVNK